MERKTYEVSGCLVVATATQRHNGRWICSVVLSPRAEARAAKVHDISHQLSGDFYDLEIAFEAAQQFARLYIEIGYPSVDLKL